MPKRHLSDQFLRNLKPKGKRVEYYDQHLIVNDTIQRKGAKGLFVRLTKAGSIYFYYRYWFHGKARSRKIDSYPNISLTDARERARGFASDVNNGIDPQAEKNAKKRKPETFQYLADQFKKKHLSRKLKPSTQKTYTERIDQEMIPYFKDKYVKDISRNEIIELLEQIAYERQSPIHSNRVRAILSSMFSFGVQRGIVEFNPVKIIEPLGKENDRERILEADEIQKLWQTFETLPEPSRSLFKMLLTLGQRLGETRRMKWKYTKNGIWTIPKTQTKANRKHFLPLSPLAVSIIERINNDSDFVFASPIQKDKPVSTVYSAWYAVRKNTGIDDIRIHDLRRTAATYLAELGTDRTTLGKVLNHKGLESGAQVTARYDRHGYMDEKKQALNRWSYKLQQIIEGKAETKITKLG